MKDLRDLKDLTIHDVQPQVHSVTRPSAGDDSLHSLAHHSLTTQSKTLPHVGVNAVHSVAANAIHSATANALHCVRPREIHSGRPSARCCECNTLCRRECTTLCDRECDTLCDQAERGRGHSAEHPPPSRGTPGDLISHNELINWI